MKRFRWGVFVLTSILGVEAMAVQAVERTLVASEGYIDASDAQNRCGDYFVLETKKFGDFEVKELHVVFELPSGVATSTLYASDVAVAIDESKTAPVLLLKHENHELKNDTVRLSEAAYEDAKECLPAPVKKE